MKLYSYWRSTTSIRVRAALNLKGVAYKTVPVNLVAGDQRGAAYTKINPAQGVPSLELDDGTVLTQSHAILEYLDAVHPKPNLFPTDPKERARQQAAAFAIAMDIHPVNNLKVLTYLKTEMGQTQQANVDYMCHWMAKGFDAFQSLIETDTPFAFGQTPMIADLCLVGQMYNARRWGLDLAPYARLTEIDARAQKIEAIRLAMPEHQPDADPS
jgi:maleylacetoacetate isomerase/maleylpyruvate isomerase